MSNFAAQFENAMVQIEATNLAFNHATASPHKLSLRAPEFSGVKAVGSPAAPSRTNRVAQAAEMFGGTCLFERVLVVPRSVALGAVLALTTWTGARRVEGVELA